MLPQLPPELWLIVISFVEPISTKPVKDSWDYVSPYDEDVDQLAPFPPDLCPTSWLGIILVSRTWYNIALPHLYREVDIRGQGRLSKFLIALRSPHWKGGVGALIKKAIIQVDSWAPLSDTLCSVLQATTDLRSLWLLDYNSSLLGSFKLPLLPKLEYLYWRRNTITFSESLYSLLRCCANAKVIRLNTDGTQILTSDQPLSIPALVFPYLHTLAIDGLSGGDLRSITSEWVMPNLRYFHDACQNPWPNSFRAPSLNAMILHQNLPIDDVGRIAPKIQDLVFYRQNITPPSSPLRVERVLLHEGWHLPTLQEHLLILYDRINFPVLKTVRVASKIPTRGVFWSEWASKWRERGVCFERYDGTSIEVTIENTDIPLDHRIGWR
jgi:hypothetical protein